MKYNYKKEIDKIVKQLQNKYKPEKIILFGSFARGKPKKDSDLDLFIVKKTRKNTLERILEVDKILFNRNLPLDILVYTPRQIKERLTLGDFFVEDILNKGKILYEKPR